MFNNKEKYKKHNIWLIYTKTILIKIGFKFNSYIKLQMMIFNNKVKII